MKNADLLALLREARRNLKDVEIRNEDTGKWEWENKDLRDRIDAALAESQDSAKPVVAADDVWWEDKTFRAALPGAVLSVKSDGPRRWYWYVGFPKRMGQHGLVERCEGVAATLDDAKKAAVEAAKGAK